MFDVKDCAKSIQEMFRLMNHGMPMDSKHVTFWNYFGRRYLKLSRNHPATMSFIPHRNRKEIVQSYSRYCSCSMSDARKLMNCFLSKGPDNVS